MRVPDFGRAIAKRGADMGVTLRTVIRTGFYRRAKKIRPIKGLK